MCIFIWGRITADPGLTLLRLTVFYQGQRHLGFVRLDKGYQAVALCADYMYLSLPRGLLGHWLEGEHGDRSSTKLNDCSHSSSPVSEAQCMSAPLTHLRFTCNLIGPGKLPVTVQTKNNFSLVWLKTEVLPVTRMNLQAIYAFSAFTCHGDIRSDVLIKADGKDTFCFLSPPPFFFCFVFLLSKGNLNREMCCGWMQLIGVNFPDAEMASKLGGREVGTTVSKQR